MLKLLLTWCIGVYVCGFRVSGHKNLRADCPCGDPALCQPITNVPDKEIFVFAFSKDENEWSKFNWTKVTTVVSGINVNLTCYAHKHGARSILLTDYPLNQIKNETNIIAWINKTLKDVVENYMDGVNIDVEEPIPMDRKDLRDAYSEFILQVSGVFHSLRRHYQVTVDVPYSPNCIYGRCYDYYTLGQNSDFLLIMDYDEANLTSDVAQSNSDFYKSSKGLKEYLDLGVPKESIVMAFPWYGYSYPCLNTTSPINQCKIDKEIKRTTQKTYTQIMDLIKDPSIKVYWDDDSRTPYFSYINQSITFQVQFDNLTSLQLKYEICVSNQIRGVGMWVADNLDYSSNSPDAIKQRTQMWQALPDYNHMSYPLFDLI